MVGGDIPRPPRGTLTPLVPLSLRAFNGEGERRTEARTGAMAPVRASSSVLGERHEDRVGGGVTRWLSNARAAPRSYFEWPQHERPHTEDKDEWVDGKVWRTLSIDTRDPSRGIGMTGEKAVGMGGGGVEVGEGVRDKL